MAGGVDEQFQNGGDGLIEATLPVLAEGGDHLLQLGLPFRVDVFKVFQQLEPFDKGGPVGVKQPDGVEVFAGFMLPFFHEFAAVFFLGIDDGHARKAGQAQNFHFQDVHPAQGP